MRNYRGQEALDRFDFQDLMEEKIKLLQMPEDLLTRSVNVGFSGGEKKRNDICKWRCWSRSCAFLMSQIPGWILMH
ncbi:cysteine desulfurase [Klebsiella aerogenes]|nr:cysteine desulfurase [Klebsiella aerogenes]